MNTSYLVAAFFSFLTTPQAIAYLSPIKEIPAKVEIVRVRAEKDLVKCVTSSIAEKFTTVAAAPCLGGQGGPAVCPVNSLPSPGVPAKRVVKRRAKVPVPPVKKNPGKALVTRYYGEDENGDVKIVVTKGADCVPSSVIYRKSKEVERALGTNDIKSVVNKMENFHRGCTIELSLAPEGELLSAASKCRSIPAFADEDGSSEENSDSGTGSAN